MKLLFNLVVSLFFTILAGALIVLLLVVNLSPPEFDKTQLSSRQFRNYYEILTAAATHPGGPVELKIPLEEGSYLLERHLPGQRFGGFELVDVKLFESSGKAAIKLAVKSPLGVYSVIDFVGELLYERDDWTVSTDKLRLGALPITPFASYLRLPRLPEITADNGLKLEKLTVTADGIVLFIYANSPLLDLLG